MSSGQQWCEDHKDDPTFIEASKRWERWEKFRAEALTKAREEFEEMEKIRPHE